MPTSSAHTDTNGASAVGRLLTGDEQRVFYPERADRVWLIDSGRVDLFCQKMVDGEYGARQYIASFDSGQAIFGIDLQQHGGLSLVGVLHPGTRMRPLSRPVFRRLNTLSPALAPARLTEHWIHALTIACMLSAPPRETQTIAAEARLTGGESGLSVTPEELLCWVRTEGGGLFFGVECIDAAVAGFPLSRPGQAWLQLPPGGAVSAVHPWQVEFADPGWDWLNVFHAAVLACLERKRQQSEDRWKNGLFEQQKSDARLVHQTLKSLTSPLAPSQAIPALAAVQKDPMLAACKALEHELGVEFKAAPPGSRTDSFRYAVEAIAHASAVRQRKVTLRGEWWKIDSGPLLAMRQEDKRPLALLYRNAGYYERFEPVEASWHRMTAALANQISPNAYLFYHRLPLRSLGSKELTGLIFAASKRDLLRVLLLGTAGGVLSMAFPLAVGIVFDTVIPGAERGHLAGLTSLLTVVAVATAALTLGRSLATLRVEARMDVVAQAAIWDRLLRLPAPFFRRFSSGDLALRSLAINSIRMILTNSTLAGLLAGVFSLFNLVLLFYFSARIAWLAIALSAAFVGTAALAARVQMHYTRQMARLRGRISAILLEFMNGISKLRVSGAETRAFGVWAQLFSQQKRLYMKLRRVAMRLAILRSIYPVAAIAILFLLADPASSAHGRLSTGVLLASLAAFVQFIATSMQFTSAFPSIVSILPVFERMVPILETTPEVEEGRDSPGELRGGIEVSHLRFRYDSASAPVLRDVSFRVQPGEFVAFTGPSGSGKSTLLRLLLGFELPEGGTISYDDQDIRGIDVQALRRQIGVVLQSGRLVSGTILDNIIGSLPLSHDDAWEAARMAGFDKDLKAMPMGMHTFVNDGGGGLSGGQRQRLMIARAIVSRPRILFFDEATSALDNATQAVVCRSLETLRATRVVIAHRLSTIEQADRIYVFDKGLIVQTGTYAELSGIPGLFQTLVQRQIV